MNEDKIFSEETERLLIRDIMIWLLKNECPDVYDFCRTEAIQRLQNALITEPNEA